MRGSRAIVLGASLLVSGAAAQASGGAEERAVAVARDALAREISVDARRMTVATVEAVVWPDGSLGCPRAGMSYTQAQVMGHRVVLRVASAAYEMHVSGDRAVRCVPASKSVDAESLLGGVQLAKRARNDLAGRLHLDASEIAIDGIQPVRWPDPKLPCAESKGAFTSPGPGYVIRLTAHGRSYAYHADEARIAPCGPQAPDTE